MSDYKKKLLGELAEDRKEKTKPGPAPDPQSLTAQLERGEVSQLKVLIPKELHRKLKMRSVQTERTLSEMTAEALEEYLRDE